MNLFLIWLLNGCQQKETLTPDETLDFPTDTSDTGIDTESGIIDTSDTFIHDTETDGETGDSTPCVPDSCDGILDPNTQPTDSYTACISFSEQSASAGLNINGLYHAGASLVDINEDGLTDIYLLNYDAPNQMFLNLGGGVFQDVSTDMGLSIETESRYATWADYDTDGDLDLLLSGFNGSELYRNDAGVFALLSGADGIHDPNSAGASAWIETTTLGAGFLIATDNGTQFYPYNGGDQFVSDDPRGQAVDVGFGDGGTGAALALADYDDDGFDDVYLANTSGINKLFQHQADDTYLSVAEAVGAVENGDDASTDVEWLIYPGDLLPSASVVDYDGSDHFYRNQQNGTFVDQAPKLGIADAGETVHVAWADYLTNGLLALFLGRDGENILYHPLLASDGTISHFQNLAHAVGVDDNTTTLTADWLDYDDNGFHDILVTTFDDDLRLYENDSHEVRICPE